ncbi:MAG: hypothetical protein NZ561_10765 [Phycisphaerae bacterium]|nr:hypothetical protein [Phycisphaerae bacterium]MDW8262759.1 hypothetical protein [Phycisphaerales bacterium]
MQPKETRKDADELRFPAVFHLNPQQAVVEADFREVLVEPDPGDPAGDGIISLP